MQENNPPTNNQSPQTQTPEQPKQNMTPSTTPNQTNTGNTNEKPEIQKPPTIIVSNTNPITPPPAKEGNKKKNPFPLSMVILLMLIAGIGLGIFLVKEFPQFNQPTTINPITLSTTTGQPVLTIPKDAVQIETCEDNKGSLFVKPQDIPQGPIYMSYKGNVIGVEFMLNLNQVMKNGKFDYLPAQNVKIDHVKFGYLSEGHEGNPVPHFHADLYTVSKNIEENIKCPPGQSQQMNMPGMDMYPGSQSATMSPMPSSEKMLMNPSGAMQMATGTPKMGTMH